MLSYALFDTKSRRAGCIIATKKKKSGKSDEELFAGEPERVETFRSSSVEKKPSSARILAAGLTATSGKSERSKVSVGGKLDLRENLV